MAQQTASSLYREQFMQTKQKPPEDKHKVKFCIVCDTQYCSANDNARSNWGEVTSLSFNDTKFFCTLFDLPDLHTAEKLPICSICSLLILKLTGYKEQLDQIQLLFNELQMQLSTRAIKTCRKYNYSESRPVQTVVQHIRRNIFKRWNNDVGEGSSITPFGGPPKLLPIRQTQPESRRKTKHLPRGPVVSRQGIPVAPAAAVGKPPLAVAPLQPSTSSPSNSQVPSSSSILKKLPTLQSYAPPVDIRAYRPQVRHSVSNDPSDFRRVGLNHGHGFLPLPPGSEPHITIRPLTVNGINAGEGGGQDEEDSQGEDSTDIAIIDVKSKAVVDPASIKYYDVEDDEEEEGEEAAKAQPPPPPPRLVQMLKLGAVTAELIESPRESPGQSTAHSSNSKQRAGKGIEPQIIGVKSLPPRLEEAKRVESPTATAASASAVKGKVIQISQSIFEDGREAPPQQLIPLAEDSDSGSDEGLEVRAEDEEEEGRSAQKYEHGHRRGNDDSYISHSEQDEEGSGIRNRETSSGQDESSNLEDNGEEDDGGKNADKSDMDSLLHSVTSPRRVGARQRKPTLRIVESTESMNILSKKRKKDSETPPPPRQIKKIRSQGPPANKPAAKKVSTDPEAGNGNSGDDEGEEDTTTNHVMIPDEEGNYTCELGENCGKVFKCKERFREHLDMHAGQAPICQICNKVFPRKYNLDIHMRTHTGEKPHNCSICGVMYADRSNLNAHLRKHMEKPFNCIICHKLFESEKVALKHARAMHVGETPEEVITDSSEFLKFNS